MTTGQARGAMPTHWIVEVGSAAETARFAADLAPLMRAGDVVTLGGGLGVGKTTFARALIRTLCDDPGLETPSPTFTLMQSYAGAAFDIVHADLYRIDDPAELDGLGWTEAGDDALLLVEWAERAGGALAPDRIDIAFAFSDKGEDARVITVTGHGALAPRLTMAKAIRQVLARAGFAHAPRRHIQGDASTRAYERLDGPGGERGAILMIAPRRPDGPPVRHGKPYSQIAKLAEDVRPFVALADGLRTRGFSAPAVYAADLAAGLLVIEDLGLEGVTDNGAPLDERYLEAAAALAALHQMELPHVLPVAGAEDHAIPRYDLDAMLMECELLLDWYLPHLGHNTLSASARNAFVELWTAALSAPEPERRTWTLRDYHSPNLIWMPEREGLARVGMLDFQDCVLGPPAYDVASLAQDARLDVPDALEMKLIGHYVRLRRAADPLFDAAGFARSYALMGAQRATKILGIFARLNHRDGKPGYLKHLPRIERNVRRCLLHPALADLRSWYETSVPGLFPEG